MSTRCCRRTDTTTTPTTQHRTHVAPRTAHRAPRTAHCQQQSKLLHHNNTTQNDTGNDLPKLKYRLYQCLCAAGCIHSDLRLSTETRRCYQKLSIPHHFLNQCFLCVSATDNTVLYLKALLLSLFRHSINVMKS